MIIIVEHAGSTPSLSSKPVNDPCRWCRENGYDVLCLPRAKPETDVVLRLDRNGPWSCLSGAVDTSVYRMVTRRVVIGHGKVEE